jgi:hypothetical protein
MKSISQDRQVAHQVGHEEDRALEHADQEQIAARVVGGDLLAELLDALLEGVLVDEDLRDRLLQLGGAHSLTSRVASIRVASTRVA